METSLEHDAYLTDPAFRAAFEAQLDKATVPGCHLWTGYRIGYRKGSHKYGRVEMPPPHEPRERPAHSVALELHLGRRLAPGPGFAGRLQANRRLDLCSRQDCCNPLHLYEGTHRENLLAAAAHGHSARGTTMPVELLSSDDIRKLIQACTRGTTGHRNRALIVLLWRTGLRISEALDLHLKDLDLTTGTVHVLRGKGKKQRMVGIDPKACEFLAFWLRKRSKIPGLTSTYVFCTLDGHRLGNAYSRTLFPRLALIAGIEKRVHAHALRHAHAVELLCERVPLNLIQRQLGHASLKTTSTYLNHVTDPDLAAALRNRAMPKAVAAAL